MFGRLARNSRLKAQQSLGKRQWVKTVVTSMSENFNTSAVIVIFVGGAVCQTVGDRDVGFKTVIFREGLHNRIIKIDNNEHRNSQAQ